MNTYVSEMIKYAPSHNSTKALLKECSCKSVVEILSCVLLAQDTSCSNGDGLMYSVRILWSHCSSKVPGKTHIVKKIRLTEDFHLDSGLSLLIPIFCNTLVDAGTVDVGVVYGENRGGLISAAHRKVLPRWMDLLTAGGVPVYLFSIPYHWKHEWWDK